MHTKAELLELLRAHRLRLRKRLGQHYLIDPRVCERLVERCDLAPHDTVIEIGAGLGALTDLLAERCKRVIAVEVDRAVSEVLRQRMAPLPNVDVRCEDILKFPWSEYRGSPVVGAIPYQLTSPILVSLCEGVAPACYATSSAARTVPPRSPAVAAAWLGMQQEVAQRLCAAPGSKAYGRLTVLVQYRFAVTIAARIPRGAFFPQPEVESAWVRLVRHPRCPVTVEDEALLFEVVRAAFSQRRKTLANCLMSLVGTRSSLVPRDSLAHARSHAVAAVQAVGLSPGVRGETLSLETFARLTNHLRRAIFTPSPRRHQ